MKQKFNFYSLLLLILVFSCSVNEKKNIGETAKISIREIGNQLLLNIKDSTSLVLPIREVESSKYRLSFQNNLSINPDSLVVIVGNTLEISGLPKKYRVEVLQCEDDEVAYSYQIYANEGETIIPCSGRELPLGCYDIEIGFLNTPVSKLHNSVILYSFGGIAVVFILFIVFRGKKSTEKKTAENYIVIGCYKFYKTQNKLIREAEEIALSKKECELLDILVANANKVVTRDELTKRVWEDNGVIVGRSLDTFISKLRKKLKDDTSIKLTNVHGVGYKLIITRV